MILEAFFGFVLEIVGDLIGAVLMESISAGFAGIMPLRLRFGSAWRWRARQVILDRRIAKGSYLRHV